MPVKTSARLNAANAVTRKRRSLGLASNSGMAIHKLIANGSFGPDEIEAMTAAYDAALIELCQPNNETRSGLSRNQLST